MIVLAGIVLLFSACEKMVDVEDGGAHELVLNGVPTPDRRAFVYFAQTRFFLDSSNNQPVAPDNIVLTVNGTPLTPDSVSRCRYFFPYTLREDDSLTIEISARGREVQARTYVPRYPAVNDVTAAYFASPSFNFHVVNLRLDDRAGVKEYYNVMVTERDSGLRYNEWTDSLELVDTVHSTYFLVPYNPEVTSNDVCPFVPLGGYLYSRIMFLDRNIDGQQYPLQLFIMQTIDTNERAPFKHEYMIDVESITPARWNYILSAASQNSMFSFFAEQGETYGNVEGAVGVFAGSASRHYIFNPDTVGTTPVPVQRRP
ncbi:MAG: DUF4249 family protein [Bacteroidales bacterium]|nr:DUF4249 family protein [Bacteroidales bacterium]